MVLKQAFKQCPSSLKTLLLGGLTEYVSVSLCIYTFS